MADPPPLPGHVAVFTASAAPPGRSQAAFRGRRPSAAVTSSPSHCYNKITQSDN